MKQNILLTLLFLCLGFHGFSQKKKQTASAQPKQEISYLPVKAQSGQITFTQKNKTVFYFNPNEKKGKIKVLGNEYELNEYFIDSKTKSYTILGKNLKTDEPVSISLPDCHFRKPQGEDCFYGTCLEASVSIPDYTVYLREIAIQDCSSN